MRAKLCLSLFAFAHLCAVAMAQEQPAAVIPQRIVGSATYLTHVTVIDLIAGLWDMHVHAVFAERLDSMFPTFVTNGVLGIRDMGTSMPFADIGRLRQQTANGSRLGPRIVVAGPILDGRPKPLRPDFLAITTPEEGRDTVRRLKTGGADLIKVILIASAIVLQISSDLLIHPEPRVSLS
jgi:hypothetical protein